MDVFPQTSYPGSSEATTDQNSRVPLDTLSEATVDLNSFVPPDTLSEIETRSLSPSTYTRNMNGCYEVALTDRNICVPQGTLSEATTDLNSFVPPDTLSEIETRSLSPSTYMRNMNVRYEAAVTDMHERDKNINSNSKAF
ncbi:hypothetical protein SNE40_015247 [Patella caerulea]|uniref:Uncharacterized protein n=1 Tax=Patella caerulea TaxID=87958 RepID=A0AAN8JN13_PATCE